MVCHALGRCRICARKHNLPIFGSEENQHALMEKVHLQLIVLNTVCIECIGKFEQYVKENDTITKNLKNSSSQCENNDCYKPHDDTTSTAQCESIDARPTMQFYRETDNAYAAKMNVSSENERIKRRKDSNVAQDNVIQYTRNKKINGATEMRSLMVRTNVTKIASKVQAKRKAQFQLNCEFCSKEFTHSGDLKRHKRKHTGEKPYECSECHKMFSQLSNLTRHRLVHSGERPFACAECGQSYSRKGRLANHIGRELCRRKRKFT